MAEDKSEESDEESEFANPAPTDFHGLKRELLRKGRIQGELDWEDVLEELPRKFMSDTELEVFLFTCENMGIEIKGIPEDPIEEAVVTKR